MLRSDGRAALQPKETVAVTLQLHLCTWHLHAVNGAACAHPRQELGTMWGAASPLSCYTLALHSTTAL